MYQRRLRMDQLFTHTGWLSDAAPRRFRSVSSAGSSRSNSLATAQARAQAHSYGYPTDSAIARPSVLLRQGSSYSTDSELQEIRDCAASAVIEAPVRAGTGTGTSVDMAGARQGAISVSTTDDDRNGSPEPRTSDERERALAQTLRAAGLHVG